MKFLKLKNHYINLGTVVRIIISDDQTTATLYLTQELKIDIDGQAVGELWAWLQSPTVALGR